MRPAGSLAPAKLFACTFVALCVCAARPAAAQTAHCVFNSTAFKFAGTPQEQARCLLSPVSIRGAVGPPLAKLPEPLDSLVGQPVAVTREALRSFLAARGITEAELGGSLDARLSRANDNDAGAPFATYFVIHDTSSPNLLRTVSDFPADVNAPDFRVGQMRVNDPATYRNAPEAHLYITRDGRSTTAQGRTFSTALRATRRESRVIGVRSKGLFLHVENVQPRRSNPQGAAGNDQIAPVPGFSDAHLDRLALVYLAASLRRGTWMIPAYHAVLDKHPQITGGHDDPQNFDLPRFAERLCALLTALGAQCPGVG